MKQKLILILFLFYSAHSFGQLKGSIIIKKMKTFYVKGDVMKIEIVNNKKKNVWIENLSLEKNDSNNVWETIVPDLLSKNCGKPFGIQGFLMKRGKKINKVWNPKSMNKNCFNYTHYAGQFRIAFNYGYTADSINIKLYSNKFLIK